MKTAYYLAYGSNLDLKSFQKRCFHAKLIGSSMLLDYALVFKGDIENNGYLTLEKMFGSCVPIGIFEILEEDISRIDQYEGYPELYTKKFISFRFQGRTIRAFYYIMNENFDYALPTFSYFKRCVMGYHDFGFDYSYLVNAFKRTNKYIREKSVEKK